MFIIFYVFIIVYVFIYFLIYYVLLEMKTKHVHIFSAFIRIINKTFWFIYINFNMQYVNFKI